MEPILPIIVNTPEGKRKIDPDEIMYLRAEGKRTEINCIDNQIIIANCSLNWFEEKLTGRIFLRSHRSFIINVLLVKTFTCDTVVMDSLTRIPVGRQYRETVRKYLTC
jgi:DNA-binding LytR/AlgR family response regulator